MDKCCESCTYLISTGCPCDIPKWDNSNNFCSKWQEKEASEYNKLKKYGLDMV